MPKCDKCGKVFDRLFQGEWDDIGAGNICSECFEKQSRCDGCPECGIAYSFVFGYQFHKKGCKIGEMEANK